MLYLESWNIKNEDEVNYSTGPIGSGVIKSYWRLRHTAETTISLSAVL